MVEICWLIFSALILTIYCTVVTICATCLTLKKLRFIVNVNCYACVFFESPYIKLKFKAVSVQATKEHGG